MSFVRFCKSSMSLFNISIITATASCISLEDIFHSFASSTNEYEFKTLCLFLFKVSWIILTKCFEVPYGGDPVVYTTALIG